MILWIHATPSRTPHLDGREGREGERSESCGKSSIWRQGIRLYVGAMQVIWILTAVLIVTLFIQYRRRLKR